jgi:ADP-heptose:LPS heptosyltransferase
VKILIIQLARLGDILLTWPQVRAIKRLHPEAQVDMLVRPRFKDATKGLNLLTKVIEFPVENIFEPLFNEPLDFDKSLEALDGIIQELKQNDYQWIINSSLSPASSYLTYALAKIDTKLSGYSRTADGYLAIADDVSAYIYAQVGVDRDNRIHLADLFTLMVDAQPDPDDWKTACSEPSPVLNESYVVLHVGASRPDKRYSAFKWRTFITHFSRLIDQQFALSAVGGSNSLKPVIVLIGNQEEANDASFIALGFDPLQIIDLTGKVPFEQLFPLIAKAKLYLGCDSAPLHIASLVGTPALNISLASVNFWETGPRSPGSRVLYAETEADLPSEKVAHEAVSMLADESPQAESIYVTNSYPSYVTPENTRNQDWSWKLIFALYMGGQWPSIGSNTIRQGLKNLGDVNNVIIEQLATIRKIKNITTVSSIIERCEEIIETVGNLVIELRPLIRWYQTQKSLIGPGSPTAILDATEKVHVDFDAIIQFWLNTDANPTEELNEPPQH